MEENIQSYLDIYKEQLSYGYIQKVYLILIKYVAELKNSFPNEYRTSNVSPGYLDYTYFPFFNDFLKYHKLRFGIVLNHKEMRFELWLMGQNFDIQKKYWEILKHSKWNADKNEMPKYSVLEVILEDQIDFDAKEIMTKNIIEKSVSLALEIQDYLNGREE